MLGCANQRTWERLCHEVIQRPDLLEDPRFITNHLRGQNVEELEGVLEEIFVQDVRDSWLSKCDHAGVPAGPINNFAQALDDPHYQARGMVQEMDHPIIGKMKTIGFASKLSETPPEIRRPAPLYAQHTDEIMAELGIDESRCDELRRKGVIK